MWAMLLLVALIIGTVPVHNGEECCCDANHNDLSDSRGMLFDCDPLAVGFWTSSVPLLKPTGSNAIGGVVYLPNDGWWASALQLAQLVDWRAVRIRLPFFFCSWFSPHMLFFVLWLLGVGVDGFAL